MTVRGSLKLLAFLCYAPALVLGLSSLFLPWVTVENVPVTKIGIDVNPIVPTFVVLAAAVSAVLGRSKGMHRLASGSLIALGALALASAWQVWREATLGHAPYFEVDLTSARIRPELGLGAIALSGVLLVVSGLIETVRPRGR